MRKKPGLRFKETMWGYFAEALDDYERGYEKGKECNNRLQFWVTIHIENMEDFIKISGRKAKLTGTVSCSSLGKNLEIRDGQFNLFQPAKTTGKRRMTYAFYFTGSDNNEYYLDGYKIIYHDKGKIDLLEDMTTLFTRIYRVVNGNLDLLGSGILEYHLMDLPDMIASLEATHCKNLIERTKVKLQFFSFVYGEVRDTYLHDIIPFYYTAYENLVLSGALSHESGPRDFFFFSGIHDKDFPWGDKATFWDIALVIKEKNGKLTRLALTNHRIENLTLDVEKGKYSYKGEIFEISEGCRASSTHMKKTALPQHLKKCEIEINLKFNARPFPRQHMPFRLISNYTRHVKKSFTEDIRTWLPHFDTLGLHLTPHRVTVEKGVITVKKTSGKSTFTVARDNNLGEAEISTFQNIRWPTLYYNYFCAVDPDLDALRLHIRSDVLRQDRRDFVVDNIEEQLGKIIDHFAWLDLKIEGDSLQLLTREEGDEFPNREKVLLEINNDHYPTAVFQRRIVELKRDKTKGMLALEENMDILNLGSINCDREAFVAAVKNADKFQALDRVIEMTNFFNKLESLRVQKGKSKVGFSIIIKPNFMFMYSLKDRTTFTDPELVEHLASRIWERGYRNIAIAEARSTYGTFFTNREVRTVAQYIGLDGVCPGGAKYRVIDLSLDTEEYEFEGSLGKHPVNKEWKDADFRISFAKNKSHAYAFYSLTIKNIYGALPKENKFKEYHCERDIFSTTIEYLKHFPVHFGFIDASVSADGPFGVFADKDPNYTETIIGGDDVVAVDWIGAAKMGIDPMASNYMNLAVKEFGKPEIHLFGDPTLYPDWVNVHDIVSKLAFGLDREYYFGNFFYSIFSTMDPYFEYREKSTMRRVMRVLTDPIRSLFFERVREGVADSKLSSRLYELYTETN
jgi:uncharacterized protein (DUF362 family)